MLELAVGTGRLAVPLAASGVEVTGVDLDPAMLARARVAADAAGVAVARRLRLVEGDARTIRLPDAGGYRMAAIPLNSIFLMGSRREQGEAIATLAAHLAPGGLAVVDAWLIDADDLSRYDGRLSLEWTRDEPGTGRIVTKTASAIFEPGGVVRLTTIFEAGAPGEARGPMGARRPAAPRRSGRARRARRGGRARRRDAGRRLRPGPAGPRRRASRDGRPTPLTSFGHPPAGRPPMGPSGPGEGAPTAW